jgi:hypothetical protein
MNCEKTLLSAPRGSTKSTVPSDIDSIALDVVVVVEMVARLVLLRAAGRSGDRFVAAGSNACATGGRGAYGGTEEELPQGPGDGAKSITADTRRGRREERGTASPVVSPSPQVLRRCRVERDSVAGGRGFLRPFFVLRCRLVQKAPDVLLRLKRGIARAE